MIDLRPWRIELGTRIAVLAVVTLLTAACDGSTGSAPPASWLGPSATGIQPLSEVEVAGLTGGVLIPIAADEPTPRIDPATAEAAVRTKFPGLRARIGVVRIAMRLRTGDQVGWFVALTPASGSPCTMHAGFLDRGIEGGVVDDQTGEIFWEFVCG